MGQPSGFLRARPSWQYQPTTSAHDPSPPITLENPSGLTHYTLTADGGTLVLSGQAASLEYGSVVGALGGSYSLTVGDANLEFGRVVTASVGGFVVTVGDATLTYAPGLTHYTLIVDSGDFALSGQDASLKAARLAGVEAGESALSVFDAGLVYDRVLGADFGTYSLSGIDANLDYVQVRGGAPYIGGSASFWLEPLPPEKYEYEAPKKAVQIIKRVAEKQAEKQEFKLAPLKVAFQRANYKYRQDYADIYRRAYEAALVKLRQDAEDDDEEAILMLM